MQTKDKEESKFENKYFSSPFKKKKKKKKSKLNNICVSSLSQLSQRH